MWWCDACCRWCVNMVKNPRSETTRQNSTPSPPQPDNWHCHKQSPQRILVVKYTWPSTKTSTKSLHLHKESHQRENIRFSCHPTTLSLFAEIETLKCVASITLVRNVTSFSGVCTNTFSVRWLQKLKEVSFAGHWKHSQRKKIIQESWNQNTEMNPLNAEKVENEHWYQRTESDASPCCSGNMT